MINDLLDKYFISKKRIAFSHRDSIYATSACCDKIVNEKNGFSIPIGQCLRVAYYSAIGMDEKPVSSSRAIARKLGDYTEYMLLKMLEETGALVEKQVRFEIEEYNISGKLDAIILEDNIEVGIEIKSISSSLWAINEIFGSKWNAPGPKLEHILQCMIYLYAMRDRLDKFYLIYIRRDNGDIKEFKVELAIEDNIIYPCIDGKVNKSLSCNSIFKYADMLNKKIIKGEVPKRTYTPKYTKEKLEELFKNKAITKSRYERIKIGTDGDYQCIECGYKDLCIRDGE